MGFRHLYWQGRPEARIARHFRNSRLVVRRIIEELGLLPRDYFDANRFLADERGLRERGPYASAATAAQRKARDAVDAAQAARATDAGRSDFSGLVDRGTENVATGHPGNYRSTRRGGDRCLVLVRK
jgi:hypothetical protein